jgi:hypothetical protein
MTLLSITCAPTSELPGLPAWAHPGGVFLASHPEYRKLRLGVTSFRGLDALVWEYTWRRPSDGLLLRADRLTFTSHAGQVDLIFQAPDLEWATWAWVRTEILESIDLP